MKISIAILLVTTACCFGACKAFHNTVEYADAGYKVTPAQCEELDMQTFVPMWLEKQYAHKLSDDNLKVTQADSTYTYFAAYNSREIKPYKAKNTDLQKVNYKSLDGVAIKNNFSYNILPRVEKMPNIHIDDYAFTYNESNNTILVRCNYTVRVRKATMKKDHTAVYDIGTLQFVQ